MLSTPVLDGSSLSVFTYKGKRVVISRRKGETVQVGYDRQPLQLEDMTLSTWGTDATFLHELVRDALRANVKQETEDFHVWILSSGWMGGWEKALSKKPRAKDSVVLDEDLAEELLEDAKTFLSSREWYTNSGIPFRRGYLLYGPPGCGKTSFCQVLAGAMKLDICMLSLTDQNLTDSNLAQVR